MPALVDVLSAAGQGAVMCTGQPGEKLDRFGDPPGELFHRSAHGRLGDRLEFLNEPPLELGQRFVADRHDAGVFEQTA